MFKPVNLCKHDLPSGRTCRQVALKGEQGCRHHMRLFRHSETEMIQEETLQRLADGLRSLDTPTLLRAFQAKLNRIRSAVRSIPEARVALQAVLDRIDQERQQAAEAERDHRTEADRIFAEQLNRLARSPRAMNDIVRALERNQ